MSIDLHITADSADELVVTIAALAKNLTASPTLAGVAAAAVESGKAVSAGLEPAAEPAKRGRKPKDAAQAPEAPTAPADAPQAPQAVSPTPTAAVTPPPPAPAPAASPTVAATPAPAAPSAPATIDKEAVQKILMAVVQKFGATGDGRALCGALCRAHGGPNLSALNAAVYPSLYRDATECHGLSVEDARAKWLSAPATA